TVTPARRIHDQFGIQPEPQPRTQWLARLETERRLRGEIEISAPCGGEADVQAIVRNRQPIPESPHARATRQGLPLREARPEWPRGSPAELTDRPSELDGLGLLWIELEDERITLGPSQMRQEEARTLAI